MQHNYPPQQHNNNNNNNNNNNYSNYSNSYSNNYVRGGNHPLTRQESGIKAAIVPLRPGDWECFQCQAHNFARNKKCFRCRAPIQPGQRIGTADRPAYEKNPRELERGRLRGSAKDRRSTSVDRGRESSQSATSAKPKETTTKETTTKATTSKDTTTAKEIPSVEERGDSAENEKEKEKAEQIVAPNVSDGNGAGGTEGGVTAAAEEGEIAE
jgi:hypothetical protein